MSQEVEQVLDLLAERFGTTVEMLWGVLLRQAYMEGIFNIVYGVFLIAACVAMCFIWIKIMNHLRKTRGEIIDLNPALLIPLVVASIFTLIGLIQTPFVVTEAIGKMLNPQYYALEKILLMFHQ